MRPVVPTAVSLVLATALAGSAGFHYRTWSQVERCAARADTLYQHAQYWQQAASDRRHAVDSLSIRLLGLHPLGPNALDLEYLKAQGLEDPVADLVADLRLHPELIPHPGVLGGRMRFDNADAVRVLSRSWVYAPFSDGHIGGETLLEYRVRPGGRISWRVVESHLI